MNSTWARNKRASSNAESTGRNMSTTNFLLSALSKTKPIRKFARLHLEQVKNGEPSKFSIRCMKRQLL